VSPLRAPAFPERAIRDRARRGTAAAFPPAEEYGRSVFGGSSSCAADLLDAARLVPPVFMPLRFEKLVELAREPMHWDVDLSVQLGGFRSALPCFLSAFGSTQVASGDTGVAASRQAGLLGVPMVIGENLVPVSGYGRAGGSMVGRIRAYVSELADELGGVAIQQSTEDADAEVWNLVYSDSAAQPLLDSGRLAFELKVGQGAKPGLGGMTVLSECDAGRLAEQYGLDRVVGPGKVLRCSSAGTFTAEILRQQIHLLRNNFPRARAWVKLYPGRDVAEAASVAWEAGADAVTVDGAEGGTGWAPSVFLDHVGLPLSECLVRIGQPPSCLLVCGRMWEGARAVKALALGATGVGLGRAALIAVDEDPHTGLVRLAECLALEMQLLISALGKYSVAALSPDDLCFPGQARDAGAWDARARR
jgi:methylamine---glutamate N-methyltransferase subunit C